MEQGNILEARNITKVYPGGVVANHNVNLSVKKGEIHALVGENGAGKSTILKSIIGQLSLIAGTVLLDGESIERMEAAELAKKMSVVLTEQVRTELMTCEDVVGTGRYPYTGRMGLLTAEDRGKVREAMELVHAWDLASRDFSQISDGQKQRILLARAICQEPEVIVLDEPTSGLDGRNMRSVSKQLRALAEKGHIILMITHDLECALATCSRALVIRGCTLADDFQIDNAERLMAAMRE